MSDQSKAHLCFEQVMLLTSVSSDISQASMKALSEARGASSSNRPVLRKSASMAFQQAPDEIRFSPMISKKNIHEEN